VKLGEQSGSMRPEIAHSLNALRAPAGAWHKDGKLL
jgi:hypothetical protein